MKTGLSMRIIHRYLGFFLVGIMAMYALSGILMIYRNTDFLKKVVIEERKLEPNLAGKELSPKLRMRIKEVKAEGDFLYFEQGNYNKKTGIAVVKTMKLPLLLEKMEHLHKATTDSPIYWLNIFFGVSLLFFVLSTFWMFKPTNSIFKKGLYFTLGGIIFTIVLLII